MMKNKYILVSILFFVAATVNASMNGKTFSENEISQTSPYTENAFTDLNYDKAGLKAVNSMLSTSSTIQLAVACVPGESNSAACMYACKSGGYPTTISCNGSDGVFLCLYRPNGTVYVRAAYISCS